MGYRNDWHNCVPLGFLLCRCIEESHSCCETKAKERRENKPTKKDATIVKWRDKRNVLVISTNGPSMQDVNTRGEILFPSEPSIVVAFNKSMSGIVSDQMISYYSTPRKSLL